ncbi:MAG: hypothetical protein WDN25_13920 [Acetobacteraceae bacterium]
MKYVVSAAGPRGFQVTTAGSSETHIVLGDFATLHEADAFAETMRRLDAGKSHDADGNELPAGKSPTSS